MVKGKKLSAGYGAKDWLYQRVTAVIMLVAIVLLAIFLILASHTINENFISWQEFFGFTFVKVFTQIVLASVMLHAWIGMRDFWMDYVKSAGLRVVFYTLTILWLVGSFIYSVKILWA